MERLISLFSFNADHPLIFTHLDFWLFFIVVMMFFSLLHKKTLVRSVFITVASLFFYYKTSGLFVLLLIFSLIVNFYLGKSIHQVSSNKKKKSYIILSCIVNVGMLGFFKYAYFFTESFNELFHTDIEIFNIFAQVGNDVFGAGTFIDEILLPVGISFFTFQSISYVVDIYRKEVAPVVSFFDYTFFVTFFPQLVAGPIVRARDFIPQIRQPFELHKTDFSWAVFQIVKGLIKKIVLADYIAIHFIDKVADAPEAFPGFVSVLAMWGYSLQIYGDFSGYTDIAIGLSRLMGFRLRENFASPYKAINVGDFWRRWHKSLGTWLKDYLYIPLGGNRTGGVGTYVVSLIIFIFLFFITGWYALIWIYVVLVTVYLIGHFYIPLIKDFIHRDINLIITMVIGGLWHGASENFVMWGAMNGAALIVYKHWKKISPYERKSGWLAHFWKIFITFNFITFTRIWFRLEEDGLPMRMLNQIWHHFDFQWHSFISLLVAYQGVFWLMLIGYVLHWLPQRIKDGGLYMFERTPIPFQVIMVTGTVVLIYQAVSDTFKPFVYFQF